jgi:hypothetical protein
MYFCTGNQTLNELLQDLDFMDEIEFEEVKAYFRFRF